MGRGRGKTPQLVVDLLKKAVAEKSQSAVSKETELGLAVINRYLRGIGEPTYATLEKLARYFGVSVVELRGDVLISTAYERAFVAQTGLPFSDSATFHQKYAYFIEMDFDAILGDIEGYSSNILLIQRSYIYASKLLMLSERFYTNIHPEIWHRLRQKAIQVIDKYNGLLEKYDPVDKKIIESIAEGFS